MNGAQNWTQVLLRRMYLKYEKYDLKGHIWS